MFKWSQKWEDQQRSRIEELGSHHQHHYMATLRENPAKSQTLSGLHIKSHDQLLVELYQRM